MFTVILCVLSYSSSFVNPTVKLAARSTQDIPNFLLQLKATSISEMPKDFKKIPYSLAPGAFFCLSAHVAHKLIPRKRMK